MDDQNGFSPPVDCGRETDERGEAGTPLAQEECRALLSTGSFGRVGTTSGGLPVILPVSYAYSGGALTFRTEAYAALRAAVSGDVLAFQVDAWDSGTTRGWSVLVVGRATVAGDGTLHLDCEQVTGRRFGVGPRADRV